MVQEIKTKQNAIEKNLNRLTKQIDQKEFDLAKSSHAVNSFTIF